MQTVPCPERRFRLRINAATYAAAHLRWLQYLSERLGVPATLDLWKDALAEYDEALLRHILNEEWHEVPPEEATPVEARLAELAQKFFPPGRELSAAQAREIIEGSPPIRTIRQRFAEQTVEREISAYDALHLRFEGFAHLAETLIERYGKQGELITYDLVIEERLAAMEGQSGSVEAFIADFTVEPDPSSLFGAGLESEVVHKSTTAALVHVHACEWARYFRERHPQVGYLMACSSDEASFRAFNPHLRLQRTQTLMEGAAFCDFWVYGVQA